MRSPHFSHSYSRVLAATGIKEGIHEDREGRAGGAARALVLRLQLRQSLLFLIFCHSTPDE
jgi:hypothetical protein